ncbi:DUF2877 domain-containing protein [Anaerosinus massiliensis]|uniref:DUF2877 domain-containing protein n=1 Tax=Massilibacillus massiliensis TaxID=1806837 RepID=UPI000DA5F55A|nr:DUF2877 domain-containing protein [Massilibacillus massiliensis]
MLKKTKQQQNRKAKSNLLPFYLKDYCVGKVHSKFNQGLNLQFEDRLIYIGRSGTPLSAFGFNIEEEKLLHILKTVKIDDMVIRKEDHFIFYSFAEIIKISSEEAEEIDLKIPQIKCKAEKISDTALYKYLTNIQFEQSIGIELNEKTKKYVVLLSTSDKADLNLNLDIIRFFTGRGKGLTPSGDDILLGFTLCIHLFGDFPQWKQMLAFAVTNESTTMISVAYLNALLQGYVSESCIQLVKLLDHGETEQIQKKVEQVKSFGHTSGSDTLFGFLLGLNFLIHQWEG